MFILRSAGRILLAASLVAGVSDVGLSQGNQQPSIAQRQKMSAMHKQIAEMHLKMATCLESDKSPIQCRQEMIDTCSTTFEGNCPMMGMGHGKKGGKRRNGMGSGSCMDWMTTPPAESSTPTKTQPTK